MKPMPALLATASISKAARPSTTSSETCSMRVIVTGIAVTSYRHP
jgi:hypothetical protein